MEVGGPLPYLTQGRVPVGNRPLSLTASSIEMINPLSMGFVAELGQKASGYELWFNATEPQGAMDKSVVLCLPRCG